MISIKYLEIQGKPDEKILRGVVELYHSIFGTEKTDELIERVNFSFHLFSIVALDDDKVIGFKIGYRLDSAVYYSWLGGVDEGYRGLGIAQKMMTLQHNWCREQGYQRVQTKTLNRWRGMLILNLKQGFDIIGIYVGKDGSPKIILEKKL